MENTKVSHSLTYQSTNDGKETFLNWQVLEAGKSPQGSSCPNSIIPSNNRKEI
ncbi:MAG: hypothetical protein K0U41_06765 [Gammaproteobacteria bacterium]|nr:hypothetical protein [Gammaproteobacteria bacterium]